MEIEISTTSTKKLDGFVSERLGEIRLLIAYFLRQCAHDSATTSLYAIDQEGGLIALDVKSLLHGISLLEMKEKVQDGYYALMNALEDYPDLLHEKFGVFVHGVHPDAGFRPLKYYSLLDVGFDRSSKTELFPETRQLSLGFAEVKKPEYRLVFKRKKMSMAMLKEKFLAEHIRSDFGAVVSELKQMGMKLHIPENMAIVKVFDGYTGHELALLYPSGYTMGFDLLGVPSKKKVPNVYDSYMHWLANCHRPLRKLKAQQELFGQPLRKTA